MTFSSLTLQAITLSKHKKENMKKVILLFTLLCAALAGRAQQVYDKFLVEGKTWEIWYYTTRPPRELQSIETITLSGDTIINGRKCMKMYRVYSDGGERKCIADLYEEDGKVYKANDEYLTLWYNFNAGEGDVYNVGYYSSHPTKIKVFKVDTVHNEKYAFRRQMVACDDRDGACLYLSGIGCMSHPAIPIFLTGGSYTVHSCKVNGEVIYDETRLPFTDNYDYDFFSKYIDFLYSVNTPKADDFSADAPAFDLQGRRLAAPPAKGLYIQGGRLKMGHGPTR